MEGLSAAGTPCSLLPLGLQQNGKRASEGEKALPSPARPCASVPLQQMSYSGKYQMLLMAGCTYSTAVSLGVHVNVLFGVWRCLWPTYYVSCGMRGLRWFLVLVGLCEIPPVASNCLDSVEPVGATRR